jgi:hypothetical protein
VPSVAGDPVAGPEETPFCWSGVGFAVLEGGCAKAPAAPSAVAAITSVHIMRFIALTFIVGAAVLTTRKKTGRCA